jgi:hypothetical protein
VVVVVDPLLHDIPYLLKRMERVPDLHSSAITSVIPLDVCVLRGASRLNIL